MEGQWTLVDDDDEGTNDRCLDCGEEYQDCVCGLEKCWDCGDYVAETDEYSRCEKCAAYFEAERLSEEADED